jgi:DNA-binding FadR family transcriptional regulator
MQKAVNNQRPELRVRYTPEEFARLKKAFAKTAYNQIGTYARRMTLQEPIAIVQRNGSFDSFVEEIGVLRKEMATLRMSGDFSPENQQRLLQFHQQIQVAIDKIVDLCMPTSG